MTVRRGDLAEKSWQWAWHEPVVYFLHAPISGLVKIGYSASLFDRLEDIQAMSPVRLDLIGAISGDCAKEAELHQRFIHLREHGEWFRMDEELEAFIGVQSLVHLFHRLPREVRGAMLQVVSAANGEAVDVEQATAAMPHFNTSTVYSAPRGFREVFVAGGIRGVEAAFDKPSIRRIFAWIRQCGGLVQLQAERRAYRQAQFDAAKAALAPMHRRVA